MIVTRLGETSDNVSFNERASFWEIKVIYESILYCMLSVLWTNFYNKSLFLLSRKRKNAQGYKTILHIEFAYFRFNF